MHACSIVCHDQSEVWKLYCVVKFVYVIEASRFVTIKAESWSQTPSLRINMDSVPTILTTFYHMHHCNYHSVPGKRSLLGKRPCIAFQGATVAASIQTYGILILGKHPCRQKSRVMFKRPWALTRDIMVCSYWGYH